MARKTDFECTAEKLGAAVEGDFKDCEEKNPYVESLKRINQARITKEEIKKLVEKFICR